MVTAAAVTSSPVTLPSTVSALSAPATSSSVGSSVNVCVPDADPAAIVSVRLPMVP